MKTTVTALYGCGQTVAPHDWYTKGLPRPYRLYYIIDGEAHYFIGGERHELRRGHFYLFPSSMPFNVTQNSENRLHHLYYDFMMTPAIVSTSPISLSPDRHPLLPTLLVLMQDGVNAYRYDGQKELADTVIATLEALLSLMLELSPPEKNIDKDILTALEYIETNYMQDITVKGTAELVYLDEDYFIRKFKREIGITPYAYIKNLRMAVARELQYSGESLKNASASVGFKYASSYCRAVKKQNDMNPNAHVAKGKKTQK